MSSIFVRSTRALAEDGFRRSVAAVLLVAALATGWVVWFLRGRVAIYATTPRARIEVVQSVHAVEAPLTGWVASSRLTLGAEVEAGEILLELNAEPQRLQLAEERARLDAAQRGVSAIDEQITAAEQAIVAAQGAAEASLEAARARHREGEAAARHAEEKLKRVARLNTGGLAGEQEWLDAQAESQKAQAALEALAQTVKQSEWELKSRESDRKNELEELRGELARVGGEKAVAAATIARLEYEIDRRRIRAPIAGRLGEVADLRLGAVVTEGVTLAQVVPGGRLRLAAEFDPAAAVGRIRAGQRAWLHLAGFPSIQYGSVPARVDVVGGEVRDGHVRVELTLQPDPQSHIAFEHGLPGTVEVEVERVSPATLVLRAAGQLLAPKTGVHRGTSPAETRP